MLLNFDFFFPGLSRDTTAPSHNLIVILGPACSNAAESHDAKDLCNSRRHRNAQAKSAHASSIDIAEPR